MKFSPAEEKPGNKKPAGMESITDKGTVKLNDTVLSSIIKTVASKTPGVVRISTGSNMLENVAHFMGHSKTKDNAIKIEMTDEKINITIRIVTAYGKNIPQLASEVQLSIIQKVKEFTGIEIGRVDVIVSGVEEYNEENKISKGN